MINSLEQLLVISNFLVKIAIGEEKILEVLYYSYRDILLITVHVLDEQFFIFLQAKEQVYFINRNFRRIQWGSEDSPKEFVT